MQAAAWASDLFLWFNLDYSLSVGQGEPEKNTALASSLFRVLLLLQLWGHFYQAQQVMLFTGGHLCNVHAQWANCLPSALINVQALRVPLSNIWATSKHQVQISDGAAKTDVTGYFGGFCCQDSQSFGFWVKICGFITMLVFRVKMWLSLHCLRSKGL